MHGSSNPRCLCTVPANFTLSIIASHQDKWAVAYLPKSCPSFTFEATPREGEVVKPLEPVALAFIAGICQAIGGEDVLWEALL